MRLLFLFLISLFFIGSCSEGTKSHQYILFTDFNGHSFHGETPTRFNAMLCDGDRILALGSSDSLAKLYPEAKRVSLENRYVYPALHDAHTHFYAYGRGLTELNLKGIQSWQEVVKELDLYAKKNQDRAWLVGRGWDQNLWTGQAFPDRQLLDSLFPDKPVLLKRVDGHAAIVNAEALRLAGLTEKSVIPGGELIKRQDGSLSGVLVDNAVDAVSQLIPPPDFAQIQSALLAAQEQCLSYGIGVVTEAGLDLAIVRVMDSLQRSGELKIRVVAMLNPGEEEFRFAEENGVYQTPNLRVGSFKLYADGALGSRGALLKSPYCDAPTSGLALQSPSYFDKTCERAFNLGYQVCTHCIGDSANSLILQVYSSLLKPDNDKRWRIEHAQVVDPQDIHLFKDWRIIPSVQPTHATSDMHWVEDRLCTEREQGAYAYQTLLKAAGFLALGTDFPVEEVNPFLTILSAVYRKNAKLEPETGYRTDESLSLFETLKGMTYWPAFSAFTEGEYGSLQSNRMADFIVLDKPIESYSQSELVAGDIVREVWMNAKKVWNR